MTINTCLLTIESKKTKMNKQNRNRFIETKNILTVARWKGGWGMDEKRERIRYKLRKHFFKKEL